MPSMHRGSGTQGQRPQGTGDTDYVPGPGPGPECASVHRPRWLPQHAPPLQPRRWSSETSARKCAELGSSRVGIQTQTCLPHTYSLYSWCFPKPVCITTRAWGEVSISSPRPPGMPAQQVGDGEAQECALCTIAQSDAGGGVREPLGANLLISFPQGHLFILCMPVSPNQPQFPLCEVRGWTRSKVTSKVIPGVCRVP